MSKVKPVTLAPEDLAIDLNEFKLPGENETLAFTEAKDNQKARNELQGAILRRSERACEDHKAAIYTNAAMFNVSTGFLTSALAGAGAIVTGQTASNILAGTAALSNSTRSLVNEEVYQQMIASAVIAEIDQNRKTLSEKISEKRKEVIEEYTVEDAILDVERYNNACSFYQGISSLVQKAGKTERTHDYVIEKNKKNLQEERTYTFTQIDKITKEIDGLENPSGEYGKALDQRKTALIKYLGKIETQLMQINSFM
tara:strand:+ start:25505 stop:26272 length:768 start_codon:yes stop_codon:yes gene_type:complete